MPLPRSSTTPTQTAVPGSVDILDGTRKVYVSFGDAPRLVSMPYVLEQLAPLGMTRKSLTLFLRALNVPTLHVGRHRLIDLNTLQLALSAITRLGQPDFTAPSGVPRKYRTASITRLDMGKFRSEWKDIYRHFIVSKLNAGSYRPVDISQLAHNAVDRLMAMGFPDTLRLKTEELAQEAFNIALKTNPSLHAPPPAQPLP